jgi:diadenosine tetraphosphate (Ap4A) HIT family hydrolase
VNTGSSSGQVVMHTHAHIIPRFEGDGLVHWPTKEISAEMLEEIAEKMRVL